MLNRISYIIYLFAPFPLASVFHGQKFRSALILWDVTYEEDGGDGEYKDADDVGHLLQPLP